MLYLVSLGEQQCLGRLVVLPFSFHFFMMDGIEFVLKPTPAFECKQMPFLLNVLKIVNHFPLTFHNYAPLCVGLSHKIKNKRKSVLYYLEQEPFLSQKMGLPMLL